MSRPADERGICVEPEHWSAVIFCRLQGAKGQVLELPGNTVLLWVSSQLILVYAFLPDKAL